MIATFHVVSGGGVRGGITRLTTDRRWLATRPGAAFATVVGTTRGATTARSWDPTRTAAFVVWTDIDAASAGSAALDSRHPRARVDHHLLSLIHGTGSWNGVDVLAGLSGIDAPVDTPVIVVTRATIRPGAWRAFGRASAATAGALDGADGLVDVFGFGERPFGRLGTWSRWAGAAAAHRFAAGTAHVDAARAAAQAEWFRESLFAMFVDVPWPSAVGPAPRPTS